MVAKENWRQLVNEGQNLVNVDKEHALISAIKDRAEPGFFLIGFFEEIIFPNP